jgi:acetylornithine deacetylase/succinyl-diaminopimelate desuccinylase-like protein
MPKDPTPPLAASSDVDATIRYVDDNRARFVDELITWCKIPSISSSKEHGAEVRRSAEHLRAHLEALGATSTAILETKLHPAAYAEWITDPKKPTLLVYGHHDVQPIDPLPAWHSPPFEPSIRDGRMYGRGVVDDKGQVYIHAKAIEAFIRTRGSLPINLKMIVEGEEEIGSVHLDELMKREQKRLASDYVVVSDTAMFGRGIPSLCVGLRGIAYFDLKVTAHGNDLHSGSYGGAVLNPAIVLAKIIAQLHDDAGHVTVEGFYDSVRAATPAERQEIASLPFDEKLFLDSTGGTVSTGEQGYSTLERIWTRPALDVNGLTAGFQGEGSKTIIPGFAKAKISCRLVPDQDPDVIAKLVVAHIARLAPKGVTVETNYIHGGHPYLAPTDHPVFDVAKRAFTRAFGKPTVFMREGGSIPFVRTIADATGKPCLLMGFGQPDENAHAPNEWLDLENFHLGIKSAAYLYDELSRLAP